MKQAWSEEPDKRPTFEEIFKQVKTPATLFTSSVTSWTFLTSLFHMTVQEHHQGKEDKHYRLHAADAGTVLLQLGGPDQREDGGVGGGEAED